MADAVLSVEVRAKLEQLSRGLGKAEQSIERFVNKGDRQITQIEQRFSKLGLTTKDIADNIRNSFGGVTFSRFIHDMGLNKTLLNDAKKEAVNFAKEMAKIDRKSFSGMNAGIKDLTKSFRTLNLLAAQFNTTANSRAGGASTMQQAKLDAQNYRNEILRLNRDLAQLRLTQAQNRQSTAAAAGSYREAQQRLTALGNSIKNAVGGFNSLDPAVRRNIAEYRKLNEQIKAFDRQMGNHQRNVGNYASALSGAIPFLYQFTTAAGLVATATSAITKSFNTNLKLDALSVALRETSGDSEQFRQNMEFLRVTSDRLGLNLITTSAAFKQWQGAAKFSNLTLEETRSIFESVANAGAKLKLSNDQIQGTFLALSQMLSKGKVQAEELRGQLGERLPGAFALAAKAMGVTEKELNKMLESGEVIADDFLPKFGRQLDESFGNDKTKRIESLQASVNRLSTEWELLFKSEGATAFYTTMIDGLSRLLSSVNGNSDATRNLQYEHELMQGQFEKTYRDAVYLTQEYDNLKGKAELNKDEQQRLRDVIQQIAELMPHAVSEWGKYGNAIDINRDKIRGMTSDLIELRRLQSKGITDELNSQFATSQNNVRGWNRQIEIIQKRMKALGDSYKGRKRDEEAILRIQEKIKLEQGESLRYAEQLQGIGTVNLTKEQREVIEHFRGVKTEVQATNKTIVQNKEYWENTLKSLKKELGSMDVAQKGTEAWKKLNAQIKQAQENVDAYSVSKQEKALNAAQAAEKRGENARERSLKEYAQAKQRIDDIIIRSTERVTTSELTGIARTQEEIKQKYDGWIRDIQKVAEAEKKNRSLTATQVLAIETQAQSAITDLQNKQRQESLSAFAKYRKEIIAGQKRMEAEFAANRIKQRSPETVELVFQRRFDETALQRGIRRINNEYKELEKTIDRTVQTMALAGLSLDSSGVKNDLQTKYEGDLEKEYKADLARQIEMADTRNVFNRSLEKTNILLAENERKFQAGVSTLEEFKNAQIMLLNEQDRLNGLKNIYDQFTNGVADSFATLLTDTKSLSQGLEGVVRNLVTSLIQQAMRLAAIKLFSFIVGGVTGGVGGAALGAVSGFSRGGYTGDVGVNEPAGIVHGKEFVFDAKSTKRLGVDNLRALQTGKIPTVSDFTPKIAKNISNFKPSSSGSQRQEIAVNVNVAGQIQNNAIKVSGSRATRFERKFGRGK